MGNKGKKKNKGRGGKKRNVSRSRSFQKDQALKEEEPAKKEEETKKVEAAPEATPEVASPPMSPDPTSKKVEEDKDTLKNQDLPATPLNKAPQAPKEEDTKPAAGPIVPSSKSKVEETKPSAEPAQDSEPETKIEKEEPETKGQPAAKLEEVKQMPTAAEQMEEKIADQAVVEEKAKKAPVMKSNSSEQAATPAAPDPGTAASSSVSKDKGLVDLSKPAGAEVGESQNGMDCGACAIL